MCHGALDIEIYHHKVLENTQEVKMITHHKGIPLSGLFLP